MMTPGEGIELSYNPTQERNPNTQIKSTDVQTKSGLWVPGGSSAAREIDSQRAQEAEAQQPNDLDAAVDVVEVGNPEGIIPPDAETSQTRREANQEVIKQKTPEQRKEDIETLMSLMPDYIAQSRSQEEAKAAYRQALIEESEGKLTDEEINSEMDRMEAILERMRRNSEDIFETELAEGDMTQSEVEERRAKIDRYMNMSPEEAAAEMVQDAEDQIDKKVEAGNITETQAEEKKSELRKRIDKGLAATAEWTRESLESSSAETIFDLFLVFNTEGQFGTKGLRELAKEGSESDIYLSQLLEKGDIKIVKGLIEAMLNIDDAGELTDETLKDHISRIYEKLELSTDWQPFQERLSTFLNKNGHSGGHTFTESKIKLMFKSFNEKSPDQIRKVLGISTSETSNEAGDATGDDDQQPADDNQATAPQTPTASSET